MVKQKTNKMLAVMLVLAVMLTSLIAGAMLLAPKTSEVNAYEPDSYATLQGDVGSGGTAYSQGWIERLTNTDINVYTIVNLVITNDIAVTIDGESYSDITTQFTKSVDVSQEQDGSLFSYYKKTGTQVDTDNDGVPDKDGYNLVIYADVERIYPGGIGLFNNLKNCKSITFKNFDTSNETNLSNMFAGCSSLTSLDLGTNFDTSNVTNMSSMFSGCSSLTSEEMQKILNKLDTRNVTEMNSMFSGCSSLTSLDLRNFSTSNVIYMNSMFLNCSSLTSLNLSSFNTSNVTNMSSMFSSCSKLTSLDLSNFNTSKVTNMSNMFNGLQSLSKLDISSFNFASIGSASGVDAMFGSMSHAMMAQMLAAEGMPIDVEEYVNATNEEKIAILVGFGLPEEQVRDVVLLATSIPQIIAPADLNGLEIMLPDTYEYTDGEGNTQTTSILIAGATHTVPGYVEPILPPDVGEIDPDTPESGVTLVDLLILTMLTLTLSGVCVIILKSKNKSLNKR